MTVTELEMRMSSKELMEWQIFYALEPWGHPISEARHAVRSWSSLAGHFKGVKPEDFILDREEVLMESLMSEEELKEKKIADMKKALMKIAQLNPGGEEQR